MYALRCTEMGPLHALTQDCLPGMVCTGEGPPVLQMAHSVGAGLATLAR